jgi:hypothetical protein
MAGALACSILGLSALAGQGGHAAAASDAQVGAADVNMSMVADRAVAEKANNVTFATPNRTVLAQAGAAQAGTAQAGAAQAGAAEAGAARSTEPAEEAQQNNQSDKSDKKSKDPKKDSPKPVDPQPVAGLNQIQMNNANRIVDTAKSMGLGKDAQVIAVATAMQESNLYNLASTALPESYNYPNEGVGSDYDSVGLFQQRTSTGWGPVKKLMEPEFATKQFLKALIQIPGWQNMPVTVAAQTVQGSAFPDAYAKHEWRATQIVDALNK